MRPSRLLHVVAFIAVAFVALAAGRTDAQTDAPLSAIETAVACAPTTSTDGPPDHALHVIAAQDTVARSLFGTRDLLVIDGGTNAGVQLGQQFFIRRASATGGAYGRPARGIHTVGWLRIVAVNDSTAIASVDHVCGGILRMDYLEPFVTPVVPAGAERDEVSGEPDFSSLGRVLGANESRSTAGAGDFVLIDRGSEQGVTAGTRFAIYRDIGAGGVPLASIGEAVVITVGRTLALTRITRSRDAVQRGDYVAPRR